MGLYARNVHFIEDHDAVLHDPSKIAEMRENILLGDSYIAKNVVPKNLLIKIRKYLIQIGQNSLPNYHPIQVGAPNFHRLNQLDERSYVQGCFHQFVFFPWNQDVFKFFKLFEKIYFLKNLLSGLPKEKFLGLAPSDGCTARLAFQFYPKGSGMLNKHADPVDHHQLTVPVMLLSKKGEDFEQGGAYVETKENKHFCTDDLMDWGDVVYFNAQVRHGVDIIDPHKEEDWLSFEGRWILLFAVNKVGNNSIISNSQDYGKLT